MSRIPNPDGPDILDIAMGQRIRERRRALGIAQKDLAAEVGVTFQQVQKYERGANRISYSRLAAIARVLNCRVAELSDGLEMDQVGDHVEREVRLAGRKRPSHHLHL